MIGLLIVHPLEGIVFTDLSGARDGGPRIDGLEQPLQIGEGPSGSSAPFLTGEARSSQPQRRPAKGTDRDWRMASSKRGDAMGKE